MRPSIGAETKTGIAIDRDARPKPVCFTVSVVVRLLSRERTREDSNPESFISPEHAHPVRVAAAKLVSEADSRTAQHVSVMRG